MKILLTNGRLARRGGTELYLKDVALGLQKRGHMPFVYSPTLGEIAKELRSAVIPVVDDLKKLSVVPDVIHGQHHMETMTALLHFGGVPAVYVCHGWIPWEEGAPRFPRILRYIAVDHACRERLLFEHGIPEDRIKVLFNFVDLERFKPREPLPSRPKRALIFSNYASKNGYVPIVREACSQAGLTLDIVGEQINNSSSEPEKILGQYDLVFAKGRAAIEAVAVGTAVILCDMGKVGPMVTAAELDTLRPVNFGIRARQEPINKAALLREIGRYNAEDAALASKRLRASAGHNDVIDELVSIYEEVIGENNTRGAQDPALEARAAAEYLRELSPRLKEYEAL
ncbi:MAG TPA: glycosyltransferase, partial [Candidatus Omnitrophota bacterium]|nr:glycosyltransferase [Candidatus Omnitrophota bacterium]